MSAHQNPAHQNPAPGHGTSHGHGNGHGHAHGTSHGHGNGHGHAHGSTDIDWEVMATHLENNGEIQFPALRRAAAHLKDLLGPEREVRRILDVGSGPGVMACLLAETFPAAEAVAVDGAPGLLDRALARAERLGLAGRVAVRHAELPEGLTGRAEEGGPGTADLVWSSRAVHDLGDQQGALDALAAVLRPGGLLAVAEGGLPMRFLPRDIGVGRPGLQARLDAVQEDWFEAMRAELPGSTAVVEDWRGMFGRAGLAGAGSFTVLLDLPAPLDGTARDFLHAHLTRLREVMGEFLDEEDRGTVDLLLDPSSPAGILRRPDAFVLAATTVFTGVRPAA
ncbi:methyltransferase domain-containing protein [Kitasatospora sp. NBC_00240]|uniref:class I SAM-dependent methyltransferase n=1 Tax=Kitasatospora sp. NBC_00240 TaxID=2903567 RepID=UPI0022547FD9|nr:class I SAM-dependent methyltransferase [Kitasatospora sp. NBC_00240]MCX5208707.1 methyltransferase domain-containing protein [Kitasatospora sp. NBC_00240]